MTDAAPNSFATFGALLRHLRLRERLTQEEFGLAVGYSRAHVARLEGGQRAPDVAAVRARFVEALHLRDEPEAVTRLIELAQATHTPVTHDVVSPRLHTEGESHGRPQPSPNNLPVPLTSFIGREAELADLERLLPTIRLLTLTGAGGVGKTRLAIELGAVYVGAMHRWSDRGQSRPVGDALPLQPTPAFPDGVWLVELASLADPALVPQAVATVLGVREELVRPLTAALVDPPCGGPECAAAARGRTARATRPGCAEHRLG